MAKIKIAVVVGSNRRDSINRQLATALTRLATAGAEFTFARIDDLPLYNADEEAPLPASAARFKADIAAADAVLVVTPEHNRSIPTVLKNAIDWGARPYGKNSWDGKLVAITGISPGAIGTAVAQQHLRAVLGVLGALVLGGEAYITFKPGLVDENGDLPDTGTRAFLQAFMDRFVALAGRLATPPANAATA